MANPSDAEIIQKFRDLKAAEEDLLAEWQACETLQAIIRFTDAPGPAPVPPPDPSVIGYRAPAGMARRDAPDPCADLKNRYDRARQRSQDAFPAYSDAVERREAEREREHPSHEEPPEPGFDEFGRALIEPEPGAAPSAHEGIGDDYFRDGVRKLVATATPQEMANLMRNAARHLTKVEATGNSSEIITARKYKQWVDEAVDAELKKRGLGE